MGNCLKIASCYCLGNTNVYPQRLQCRLQPLELLLIRLTMDPEQCRRSLLREFLSDCDVRHDHAFFDHPMSVVPHPQLYCPYPLTGVDDERGLSSIEIQRTPTPTGLEQ